MHLVLASLGIRSEHEVIVPDSTWTGSVFPISWVGATPIFVDVLPKTWCIDLQKIEADITKKTKAMVVVHLYGNLCEMDEIMAIGKKHNIPIIEDAAEAIGSEYKGKKAGSIADFGVFSLHGTKTLTSGEGGVIISNRLDLEAVVTTLESQGRRPGAKLFWVDEVGLKYKMSNIQVALGLAQFERADELVGKKRHIFSHYKNHLRDIDGLQLNFQQEYAKNSYWMPTIICENYPKIEMEKIIQEMNQKGIAARPFFYPVSSFPMYLNNEENKISRRLNRFGINLPSYFDLTEEEVHYCCEALIQKIT